MIVRSLLTLVALTLLAGCAAPRLPVEPAVEETPHLWVPNERRWWGGRF